MVAAFIVGVFGNSAYESIHDGTVVGTNTTIENKTIPPLDKVYGSEKGKGLLGVRMLTPEPGVTAAYTIMADKPDETENLAFIYSSGTSSLFTDQLKNASPNAAVGTLITYSYGKILRTYVEFDDKTKAVINTSSSFNLDETDILYEYTDNWTELAVTVSVGPTVDNNGATINFTGSVNLNQQLPSTA